MKTVSLSEGTITLMHGTEAYLSCFFAIFRNPIALTVANWRHHAAAADSSSACHN